jgi:hypothetical protein
MAFPLPFVNSSISMTGQPGSPLTVTRVTRKLEYGVHIVTSLPGSTRH